MPEKIRDRTPPQGLSRLAFRFPVWLYRIGLGRLLGSRFLEMTHTGRKSGLPRRTVLEVVTHDPRTGEIIIAAGFGEQSDWYKNIRANPQVEVRTAGRHFQAVATPLSPPEAGTALVNYAQNHPRAFHELAGFMGYRLDGTEADTYRLGQFIHLFALKPLDKYTPASFN